MKHFFATLLTFSILTFALPQKEAKAGVIIFAASTIPKETEILAAIGGVITAGTVAVLGTVTGAVISIFSPSLGLKFIYGSIILENNQSADQISAELAEKYNFIDNQLVVKELAKTIKHKYDSIKGNAYITLSESETRVILEAANLSDGEIQQVVLDLM